MQQWLLGDGEHHGGQGGIRDFFGRRNRVFGLRRYSHLAFDKASDKEPLKAGVAGDGRVGILVCSA